MPSSHKRLLTAAYFASFILLGLSSGADGPSLPTLAAHTGSPLDRVSLMFIVGSLGYVIGSFIGGRLYDRLPGHRIVVAGLACMAAATVAFPLASVLWLLLLASLFIGLGRGIIDVGCNTLLQWVHGARSGPYLNGLHFTFGLGSLLAPILIAQVLLRTADIHWAYWTMAILALPVAIWTWVLPEPPVPAHAAAQRDAAPPFVPVFLIVLAFFLYVGAELGFGNWIYTYALTLGLADKITAAYLTSAFWGLFTLGRLLAIWVAGRFHPRTILYADFAGALLSMLLLALAGSSPLALWLGSIAFGLSLASMFPTMLLLAAEKMHVTGTMTGWFLVGSGAGGLLPWLIGIAFTSAGPRLMILIICVDLILNAAALLAFIHTPQPRAVIDAAAK